MQNSRDRRPNLLIHEKSPYLLQHAFNPVDWHPWGLEAFEKARKKNKPIFLSIGYSTCHWCHVMKRESFEDPEVARLMNETFICIKVDREERPDIDGTYMAACQMMTGRGGWPLTIIMTPEKKPFFAATYIPKESRFGMVGMLDLIPKINDIWRTRRHEVEETGRQVSISLKELYKCSSGAELGKEVIDTAFEKLVLSFDERYGGFGKAPKFPTPHNLLFLLRYWRRTKQKVAIMMVEKTLRAMRFGGIFDHVGYGFHRYSTDSEWLLPHFEKMLYDQAMLAIAYIEAYQATRIADFEKTAKEILEYVLRDMTSTEGGFYSAEDAESEGEEGKYYLWTEEEIRKVLPDEEANLAVKVFNIEKKGNFFEEATGRKSEQNILHMGMPIKETASKMGIPKDDLLNRLDKIRSILFAHRERRPHPQRDDKILTDWNGLMIAALAKAAQIFNKEEYIRAALKAADFIQEKMKEDKGRLYHRYRKGEASIHGFLDDYAFFIWGLIELYETCFETKYLRLALELTDTMNKYFWDEDVGGFHYTAQDSEEILVRKKETYDGPTPSGNSVAMLNLLRLAHMTANPIYEKMAAKITSAFSREVTITPEAHTYMMLALDFAIGPSYEVVIVGDSQAEDTKTMLKALRKHFIPNKVVLFLPVDRESPEISKISKFISNYKSISGKSTAYVCENHVCSLHTTDMDKMLVLLGLDTTF